MANNEKGVGAMREFTELMDARRLKEGLTELTNRLKKLDSAKQSEILSNFMSRRAYLYANRIDWSVADRIKIAKQLQYDAEGLFQTDEGDAYALWLSGAWLEAGELTSTDAKAVFTYLDRLADELVDVALNSKVRTPSKVTSTERLSSLDRALLHSVLDAQNKNLPRQVATNARQEKCIYADGYIVHRYTHFTKTGAQMRADGTEAKQRLTVYPAICRDLETRPLLQLGIGFRFQYFGKDGQLGADVAISPADCKL